MKWLGRIIYVVAIFFIGVLIFRISQIGAQLKYYNEYGPTLLEKNERDEYMEVYMTANLIKEYLKDPIYVAENKDEKYPFEFAVYNVKVDVSDQTHYYLAFYFNDLGMDLENLIADYKKFEENKNTVAIKIEVKMQDNEEKAVEIFSLDINSRMPMILVEITEDDTKDNVFRYQYSDDKGKPAAAFSRVIEEIKFTFLDVTKGNDEENLKEATMAILKHDNNAVMNGKETDILVAEEEIFVSKNFNGKVDNYEKSANYADEANLGFIRLDDLKPYQKAVPRNMIIYTVVIVVITYLIYFLKPTIQYFKDRRRGIIQAGKDLSKDDSEKPKAIFKE